MSSSSSSLPSTSSHPPPHTSSHPPPSLLPPHCQPLPDIFSGVVAYLHGYEGEEMRRRERERYLVAYDGDVATDITDQTTHIIVRTGSEVSSWRHDICYLMTHTCKHKHTSAEASIPREDKGCDCNRAMG